MQEQRCAFAKTSFSQAQTITSCSAENRKGLEEEIQTDEYLRLFKKVKRKERFFRRFRGWLDVIAFMRGGTSDDPLKDKVLRPIFKAHTKDKDHRWRTVLLVIFYPGLESISKRNRWWDRDEDELMANIICSFMESACKLNLSKRPERLVQKLIYDTQHITYEYYQRKWKAATREVARDFELLKDVECPKSKLGFDEVDLRSTLKAEIKKLREHMEAGRISETDFLLLVRTRVYGQKAAEYARENGMSIDLARKRRLRAEKKIKNFEKNLKKCVPLFRDRGPFTFRRRTGHD